jgi:hypothetical protein
MFQPKKNYLSLSFHLVFFILLIGCEKSNGDDPKTLPVITSVGWTEISTSSSAVGVVQKDVIDFQSLNLGNKRALRILVPANYDADSVKVRLDISVENDTSKTLSFEYALNSGNFFPLPADKIITVPTGINSLGVYAVDSHQQQSSVFSKDDFSINANYKVLYMNDGQDIPALNFKTILGKLYASDTIEKVIVVGIDASSNRLN